jgi:hypothetical protein
VIIGGEIKVAKGVDTGLFRRVFRAGSGTHDAECTKEIVSRFEGAEPLV